MRDGNTFTMRSVTETQETARSLASELVGGDVLALHGDLGAGKTTFMQGLAKGLGIQQRIMSPTFVIERQYRVSEILTLHHLDLYRLTSDEDLRSIDIEELLGDPETIVAIEWPEKLSSNLPSDAYHLYFTVISEHERQLTIQKEVA